MKRKITQELIEWKRTSQGKVAPLIVGARRIGKSYIVEEFAKAEYKSYILIDFSKVADEIKELFDHQSHDLDTFFTLLQEFYGTRLYERESLLIFDEVQRFPRAREMIKHFVADGRYDYIETGSLISIRKNTENILVPSEERKMPMYPMDFEEFTWAIGAELTFDTLRMCYEKMTPLGQAVHRKIMTLFRQYLIVGGMPQAVAEYVDSRNFQEVDRIKRDILDLYRDDIYKHGGKDALRIEQMFNQIPSQLSNANKRFVLSAISDDARLREYEDALIWLSQSKMVNLCFNTTEPTVGLMTRMDSSMFKCYHSDTGLLISQTFSKKDLAREEIYKKLLFDKLEFNNGMVMENVVAQLLAAARNDLYYYAESESRMEIDFLLTKTQITSRKNIIPIEVKSGKKYRTNSLNKFRNKFKQQIGDAYVLHDGDIKEEDGVKCLPVYMAGLLG